MLSFNLDDLSIGENGVLKSPIPSVWGLLCNLRFTNVYFTSVCLQVCKCMYHVHAAPSEVIRGTDSLEVEFQMTVSGRLDAGN